MNEIKNKAFNKRSFNVILMLASFIILPFSGILIHSTHQTPVTSKIHHFAMSVHNVAAIIFVVTALIHLTANGKVLVKYIVEKSKEFSFPKAEAIVAIILVLVIVGLFSAHALLLG